MAALAAGYGVLFTIVADFRDEYGISETAIGFVIGLGFIAGFLSQIVLAPLADRGHAKKLVFIGVLVNVAQTVGKQLSYFTTGQEVPHQIEISQASRLAEMVLSGGVADDS